MYPITQSCLLACSLPQPWEFSITGLSNCFTVGTANSLGPRVNHYTLGKEYFHTTKLLSPILDLKDLPFYPHKRQEVGLTRSLPCTSHSAWLLGEEQQASCSQLFPSVKHCIAFTPPLRQLQVPASSFVKQIQATPEIWMSNPRANLPAPAKALYSPAAFLSVGVAVDLGLHISTQRKALRKYLVRKEYSMNISCCPFPSNPWILSRMAEENSFLQVTEVRKSE